MSTSSRQLTLFEPPARASQALAQTAKAGGPATAGGAAPADPRADAEVARPGLDRGVVLARAESLASRLATDLGLAVRLAVTDNRSTMVSFRRAPSSLRLRLHHMFLDAPEPVLRALADYAGRGNRHAGMVIDDFIRVRQPLIRRTRDANSSALEPRGRVYDLQVLFDKLNEAYFQGGIQAAIGWGRVAGRRRRKSIRLGVYDHQTREIRIHPALDRPEVPKFFVEFIVFHEMLHQLFPSGNGPGRRVHHPRAFRDRERAYPLYNAAIAWERENLRLLLRS